MIFHSFSLQRNVVTKDVPIVVKSFSQKKLIKKILKVVMPKTAKSVFIVSISKEFLAVYAVCISRMYRYKARVRRKVKEQTRADIKLPCNRGTVEHSVKQL